jgi:subtilisin family serine protease
MPLMGHAHIHRSVYRGDKEARWCRPRPAMAAGRSPVSGVLMTDHPPKNPDNRPTRDSGQGAADAPRREPENINEGAADAATGVGSGTPSGLTAQSTNGARGPRSRSRTAKPLLDPLLREDGAASDHARQKLLYVVDGRTAVLVELNRDLPVRTALRDFRALFARTFPGDEVPAPVPIGRQYLRCLLTNEQMRRLAEADRDGPRTIFRIWSDVRVVSHIDRSAATVKADAAARSYGTTGQDIVWAVVDSGIDARHEHFGCGTLTDPVVDDLHRDFTPLLQQSPRPRGPRSALQDHTGHGTHVAAIIAGLVPAKPEQVKVAVNEPTTDDLPAWKIRPLRPGHPLTSMAPLTRLVSLKVLDDEDSTSSAVVIAALDYVRSVNAGGRLRIHGVNLSIGCDWFADQYAAGQSPLCRAVDELVDSGVVVVVSAGNSGAAGTLTGQTDDVRGQLSTITDPGNAAKAITVGSTHRYAPHTYGISYTSSKGPTLDGRLKPELVAPGERITSAATGEMRCGIGPLGGKDTVAYVEATGTSMAAPHVSGSIAAFLSVRAEFIGQPEEVKRLFCANATSLGRHEFYQGAGLVDLMRVLSSV